MRDSKNVHNNIFSRFSASENVLFCDDQMAHATIPPILYLLSFAVRLPRCVIGSVPKFLCFRSKRFSTMSVNYRLQNYSFIHFHYWLPFYTQKSMFIAHGSIYPDSWLIRCIRIENDKWSWGTSAETWEYSQCALTIPRLLREVVRRLDLLSSLSNTIWYDRGWLDFDVNQSRNIFTTKRKL